MRLLLKLFSGGILISLLVSPSPLMAEQLELNTLLGRVERHFPLIEAAALEREKSAGKLREAQGAFDKKLLIDGSAMPSGYYDSTRVALTLEQLTPMQGVRFYGGYSITDGRWPIYDGKLVTDNGGEFRLGMDLPILRNRVIDPARADLNIAKIGVDLADRTVEQRLIEAKLSAANTYFAWVAAGLQKKIYEALLATATERTRQLEKRFEAGDVAQFDIIDNKRAELQRESQLAKAQQVLTSTELNLSLFWRDESGRSLSPDLAFLPVAFSKIDLPVVLPVDAALSQALERRPDLAQLRLEAQQNQVNKELAENQLLPGLNLQTFAAQNVGEGPQENEDVDVYTGLRFDVPLERNAAKGKVEQASARGEQLRHLKEFLQQKIKVDLQDAWQAIKNTKTRMELAQSEHAAARELEEGERVKFMHGDSNLIFLNLREQTTAEAALREIEAATSYCQAVFAYQASSAALLTLGSKS